MRRENVKQRQGAIFPAAAARSSKINFLLKSFTALLSHVSSRQNRSDDDEIKHEFSGGRSVGQSMK
jgi:hypothetical protein